MVMAQVQEPASPQALAGVRVLDFTWVRAGPWGTRWLGSLGAQVIKAEWTEIQRGSRGGMATPPDVAPNLNTSGFFNDTNANKLGITLNVRSPRGRELVRRLVGISDIVIESFSARVMQDWGLGYQELRKLKPDIVYVSMSGFGHTGRQRDYTTMGPSSQALSGLTFLSGLPDQPPAGWGWSYMDDTGGMYGAMCALNALYHRNVTGQGQHVDMSQMITATTMNGPALLDHTVTGHPSRREGYPPGNRTHWPGTPVLNNYRGPTAAPHNSYRTKPGGYDDWCVIACFSDDEWLRLAETMGSPHWATASRFATLEGRIQHQEELDQGIAQWTGSLEKYEVMERCQEAGVRAMPVQSSHDLVERDPQLRHREMYTELEHPVLGSRKLENAPFKLSEAPAFNSRPGPLIGQHNPQVFQGLLGLSREEVSEGYKDGTLWPTNVSTEQYPYLQEASEQEALP